MKVRYFLSTYLLVVWFSSVSINSYMLSSRYRFLPTSTKRLPSLLECFAQIQEQPSGTVLLNTFVMRIPELLSTQGI